MPSAVTSGNDNEHDDALVSDDDAVVSLLQASNPFFKLLTMLMEFAGGPPGMPSFASYILQRIWEVSEWTVS